MLFTVVQVGRRWNSGITGWVTLGFCLCLLLAAADRGACFNTGTDVTLTLDQYSVYRDAWETVFGRKMGGTVTVTQAGTLPENEVKLQGHRQGTLWSGETYWTMTMVKVYILSGQTSVYHLLDFGPPCAQPDDYLAWNQYYRYTATIWAGNQYKSNTKDLTVINEWDGGMGMGIVEGETL